MLDGKLRELLLLDVTPLPLGIAVRAARRAAARSSTWSSRRTSTSPSCAAATTPPCTTTRRRWRSRSSTGSSTTRRRSGCSGWRASARPAGTPQIEVEFSIDASCVLEVTARDKESGRSNSIRVTDTTLLSPRELAEMTRRRERQAEAQALRSRMRELVAEAETGDGDASWRELRHRLATYRPSAAPADEASQRTLAEIFNEVNDREVELLLVQEPLRDLAAKAREYLGREAAAADDPDLAEARHLTAELARLLDGLRPQLDRLSRWNALLVRLATADPDPLRRFRDGHAVGDFARALAALRDLPTPPEAPEDIRRQLHCLAEAGTYEDYRGVLVAAADRLGTAVLDPAHPAAFHDRLTAALVTVAVTGPDGRRAEGSGFLVSDRLVVTNRHLLTGRLGTASPDGPPTGRIEVAPASGSGAGQVVEPGAVVLSGSRGDVALLRLTAPATAAPLRLGHPKLVRIGDPVWTAGPRAPRPGSSTPSSPSPSRTCACSRPVPGARPGQRRAAPQRPGRGGRGADGQGGRGVGRRGLRRDGRRPRAAAPAGGDQRPGAAVSRAGQRGPDGDRTGLDGDRVKPGRAGRDRVRPGRAGPDETGSGQVRPGRVRPDETGRGRTRPGRAGWGRGSGRDVGLEPRQGPLPRVGAAVSS
ncbi:Hsp70 family protein [Streptomyces sp. M19]